MIRELFNRLFKRSDDALLQAAEAGDPARVRQLLNRGAWPDSGLATTHGSALIRAARAGHLEIVKMLVTAGADIDAQNYTRRSALHEAVWHLHGDVAQYLIGQGAIVETRDRPGKTPLGDAIGNEMKDVALLLARHGASADTPDEKGETLRPGMIAIGWDDVVQAIDDRTARLAREAEEKAAALREAKAALNAALDKVGTVTAPVVASATASFRKHRQTL